MEIPWQKSSSTARLKIPRPAENCGLYMHYHIIHMYVVTEYIPVEVGTAFLLMLDSVTKIHQEEALLWNCGVAWSWLISAAVPVLLWILCITLFYKMCWLVGCMDAWIYQSITRSTDQLIAWSLTYLPAYLLAYCCSLTPVYMILIGFFAVLFAYLGDGPLWVYTDPTHALCDSCKDNWWINLLYVNNIVPADRQVSCVFHSRVYIA